MGKLFCLMGKSASGKDSIYRELLEQSLLQLSIIVSYTTRPKRDGEMEGREYHFVTEQTLSNLQDLGRVIEVREYHTIQGIWKYFTADDGQVNLEEKDYLTIGTLESYVKMCEYYGQDKLVPIYVMVEDGLRLIRAITREQNQSNPGYAEICRRFLADETDFSKENLEKAGVTFGFANQDLQNTVKDISDFIRKEKER